MAPFSAFALRKPLCSGFGEIETLLALRQHLLPFGKHFELGPKRLSYSGPGLSFRMAGG